MEKVAPSLSSSLMSANQKLNKRIYMKVGKPLAAKSAEISVSRAMFRSDPIISDVIDFKEFFREERVPPVPNN